jgi:hypothetical protein
MRFNFRTLSSAISTLVVLCVLFVGMALDVSAHDRGRNWGRGHNRGRHLGWTRGRRVGHHRRDDDNDRRRWRRFARRERRDDRRDWRRHRQRERYRQSGFWRY